MRRIAALFALAALVAASAAAQGIIIDRRIRPPEPRPQPRVEPITIKTHSVETVIDGQSATTTVTQTFFNPNHWQLEGQYLFPLPPEAAISGFEMTMNGQMVKGELLPADKARGIYEETVRRMIDPGLLEYAGRGLFNARVFPILPQQDLTIKFTYSELLRYDSGLVRFGYPLRTRSFSQVPPSQVAVKVTLKGANPLRTIYSPTHKVEVIRKGDTEAVVGLEMKEQQPANDFELFYGFADGAVSASVMSFRDDEKAGYFLALLTPKITLAKEEILPKDVIVVLDTSGSMLADGKLDQAKNALKFCVNSLNDKDRFAIVTFSTEARRLHEALVAASKENKDAAIEKIGALDATGGTNFDEAIKQAYALAGKDEAARPCYVLLISDGLPTMGEVTEVRALAKQAREARAKHVRMFTFGLGYDVNTWLMDTLAEENRGQREYAKPKEELEVKLSNFSNKIASPVLSDVKLRIDGAELHDMHPQVPGDVFAGTQLSLLGRFDKPGKHQLLLEGTVNGEKRVYEYSIELCEKDVAKNWLPRMWAVRRVGFLMDQINLKGENPELKEEIVRLGTKFGIVTPYTSFLVVEDTPMPRPGQPMPNDRRREGAWHGDGGGSGGGAGSRAGAPQAPEAQTGEEAVKRSDANAGRRANDNANDAEEADERAADDVAKEAKKYGAKSKSEERLARLARKGLSGKAAEAEAEQVIKTIGTRSFIWCDGVWLESDLTNAELFGSEAVDYMSERYFELSRGNDTVAKILALGTEVIFRHGGKTYRIVEKQADENSDKNGDKSGEKKPE
ncbi:MAG: VWA domain-containing protein [Planctomycetes bacterium]|nr:VWA domain-containing protein [Planctomycetota bacterium]